jgi:hypothetical protein
MRRAKISGVDFNVSESDFDQRDPLGEPARGRARSDRQSVGKTERCQLYVAAFGWQQNSGSHIRRGFDLLIRNEQRQGSVV